jgi:hypothetical protein
MGEPDKVGERPQILSWIGGAITLFGVLIIPLVVIGVIGKYFSDEEDFFSSLYGLYDFIGAAIGICGFGAAIARGKRWHLFLLLVVVFFGGLLIGLFSMVGKETNIGYYIWAIDVCFSIFLMTFLYKYWDVLADG